MGFLQITAISFVIFIVIKVSILALRKVRDISRARHDTVRSRREEIRFNDIVQIMNKRARF